MKDSSKSVKEGNSGYILKVIGKLIKTFAKNDSLYCLAHMKYATVDDAGYVSLFKDVPRFCNARWSYQIRKTNAFRQRLLPECHIGVIGVNIFEKYVKDASKALYDVSAITKDIKSKQWLIPRAFKVKANESIPQWLIDDVYAVKLIDIDRISVWIKTPKIKNCPKEDLKESGLTTYWEIFYTKESRTSVILNVGEEYVYDGLEIWRKEKTSKTDKKGKTTNKRKTKR